jgi:hypothetical protein
MRSNKRRPGRVPPRHRPEQSINGSELTKFFPQNLGVDFVAPDERKLIAEILRQLPGLPQPRIIVLLNTPKHPVEDDAQHFANEHAEPVAVVDMEGQLLAYREPQ